jgi:hypothetical protein
MLRSLADINALASAERNHLYLALVPPEVCRRFDLDPVAFTDPQGRSVARVDAPRGARWGRVRILHRGDAVDPAFFLHLTESRFGHLRVVFIICSDPEGPRFGVDLDEAGKTTDLGIRSRNRQEEVSAMRAGLAPGQVRRGLRMLGAALERIEALALRLDKAALVLEASYYHNAIVYERHGFGYLAGESRMARIHRDFLPGGAFASRLDGSTPFRAPGAGGTILGRSWALHDGILEGPWWPPVMYRPVGVRLAVCTAPGVPY